MPKRFTIVDVFLALAFLSAAFWSFRSIDKSGGSSIRITINNRPYGKWTIAGVRDTVRLENGMTVEVGAEGARVLHSDCPRHICVHQGTISLPGQTIVCVPNRTVIQITGEEELDAVAQ